MLLFTLEKYNLRNMVSIKSYSYSKLVLAYGPNHAAIVTVQWNDKANFKLVFGRSKFFYIDFNLETYITYYHWKCVIIKILFLGPSNTVTNAHSVMKEQLEAHLNRNKNLAQIIHILNETLQPLTSISKLPTIPQLCVHAVSARAYLPFFGSDLRINSSLQRPRVPVQTFTIMPQCVTLVKIAYQGMYCLELRLRGGGLVSLRDGAYSHFDKSNVVDEFTPTQGLKVR